MGILSKILGGSSVVEKGMDIADKAFYTKQEQAGDAIKLAEAYGQNSPASSKARRFMMYLFCVPFVFCFMVGFFYLIVGNGSGVNNIINYVNTWNLPALVGGILLFYFGRQAMSEVQSNKRIKNLAILKEAEAKKTEEPKKDSEFYNKLKTQLTKHEGLRLKPYRCSAGKLSIGIGRNLDDVGIFEDEAHYLLENDIKRCEQDLDRNVDWWRNKGENIKLVLLDMCFNLGISRLLKFKNFLSALQNDDYKKASAEMMDSAWAGQVGVRAKNLQKMVLG